MSQKTEQKIKNIIFKFINENDYEIFVFGSRALGKARKYSDYDIGLKGYKKIPWNIMAKIKNSLEDSNIPFCVDIVDFSMVSEDFKKEALKKIIKL